MICGEKDFVRIKGLLYYNNELQSRIETAKGKSKKNMKKALARANERISNLVSELHKKIAKWLCENYSEIYIPRLNFHTLKNLDSTSKSILASLRHCEFVNRIIHKSNSYKNCKVIEVNEAYTSMTCGECGYQNQDLGTDKIFDCKECKSIIGRDINASRNIMLRYITKTFKLKLV